MKSEEQILLEHREECQNKPLLELLSDTLHDAAGDDWNGCFSAQGEKLYAISVEVLTARVGKLTE